jgi:hypothetical protein
MAAMNIAKKGAVVFQRPKQGLASEAMVQELGGSKEPVILKVDASKLSRCQLSRVDRVVRQPKT